MPTADGRFRSAFYSLSDEEYARIFGDECDCAHPLDCQNRDLGCKVEAILKGCECDGPCDLCVEQGGRCARGDDCRCRNGDTAEDGKWRSP